MQDLKVICEKIAREQGFKNFKLNFESGSDLGFIGLLEKCQIVEGDRKLSLYCKFLPNDNERNEKFNSFLLFEREVFIYRELFPEFEKFQLENGLNFNDSHGFWSFPKCFYSNYDKTTPNKSVIIMEDLTIDNFEVKDKFIPSDFEHTAKLFIELAKLHGLSLALKLKKPSVFEKFKNLSNSMSFVMTTESMKHIAPRNCKLILELFKNQPEICNKLVALKDNIWDRISQSMNTSKSEPFAVICHGDVWINNVLYNYSDKDKKIIKDTKLVDWQMTYYGSLGSELTYYLYCCVDKPMRQKYLNELLELYYGSMRDILRKFNIEIGDVMPFREVKRQLRVYGIYAFGMANFAIPLLCKYPEKLFYEKCTTLDKEEMSYVKDYEKRMKDVIEDMIDMKIL